MTTQPVTIGIVGCGNISSIYLQNCTSFPSLRVLACADLMLDRAREQAEKYNVPRAYGVEELLRDPAACAREVGDFLDGRVCRNAPRRDVSAETPARGGAAAG